MVGGGRRPPETLDGVARRPGCARRRERDPGWDQETYSVAGSARARSSRSGCTLRRGDPRRRARGRRARAGPGTGPSATYRSTGSSSTSAVFRTPSFLEGVAHARRGRTRANRHLDASRAPGPLRRRRRPGELRARRSRPRATAQPPRSPRTATSPTARVRTWRLADSFGIDRSSSRPARSCARAARRPRLRARVSLNYRDVTMVERGVSPRD